MKQTLFLFIFFIALSSLSFGQQSVVHSDSTRRQNNFIKLDGVLRPNNVDTVKVKDYILEKMGNTFLMTFHDSAKISIRELQTDKFNLFNKKDGSIMLLNESRPGLNGSTVFVHYQYYNGIRVLGGYYNIYENDNYHISAVSGRYIKDINPALKPKIDITDIESIIVNDLINITGGTIMDGLFVSFPKPELIFAPLTYDFESEDYVLAYSIKTINDINWPQFEYIINAETGDILYRINLTMDTEYIGNGNTIFSGHQYFTTEFYDSEFLLRDENRKIYTYDMQYATSFNYALAENFHDSDNSWNNQIAQIGSITINSVNSWLDEFEFNPDLYIRLYDNFGNFLFETNPVSVYTYPVSFETLSAIKFPFVVEVWDDDDFGSDDLVAGIYIDDNLELNNYVDGDASIDIYKNILNNPALDLHWGMQKTYDYYKFEFNRESYDDEHSPINSYTFFSPSILLNNAHADPISNNLIYGLGDGNTRLPFVAIDIVAHEFTHLVTEQTSSLNYIGESGALNESFSDIFGTAIENYALGEDADWIVGNIGIPEYNFLRSMHNPKAAVSPQPNTYEGVYWVDPTDTFDDGGVHINSGVQNYWYYLLCEGGSGINDLGNEYSVTPIGMTNATKIAYYTLINLDETSDFASAAVESKTQALLLFPEDSSIYNSVVNAWYAVGVLDDPAEFCNGLVNLTASNGEISDGSIADLYGNNSNCNWLIHPAGATTITLEFLEFFTELGHDSVVVYDGSLNTDPILLSWSGNSLPPAISSSGGEMLIVFRTDGDINDYGWTANYTSTTEAVGCSGTVTLNASSGYFSDGSGTNDYTNNNNCTWLIAPTSASGITLNFTSFNTEATYDFVKVYDGSNAASPLIGTYSGSTIPSSITSSGSTLYVVFISDGSITASGWTANYSSDGIDPITASMSSYEYWFDNNYLEKVTGTISGPSPSFNEIIDVNSLATGLHSFHIRFKDNHDLWGSILSQFFVKSEPRVEENIINDAEYWFDNDYDSKTEITGISQETYNFNDLIDVSELNNGLHSFHIRFRDENNSWCGILTQYFVRQEESVSDNTIIEGEYWIDNDYASKVDLVDINQESFNFTDLVDVSALSDGLHNFRIRFRDQNYIWSAITTQYFVKATQTVTDNSLTGAEYWFDNNYATKFVLDGINEDAFDFNNLITVEELSDGLHSFHIRFKDVNGVWNSPLSQSFVKLPQITTPNMISSYEYWFDSETYASATTISLPFPVDPYNMNELIDVSALSETDHTIHFRFRNINGLWSSVVTDTFTRESLILADFTVSPISICAGSSVTFDNLSQGATSYLWDFGDGSTSTAFEPTHIYSSGGYYTITLTASNVGAGISDILTIPNAVTVVQPNPIITASGPTTFCSGTTVTLSTAIGFTSYQWYKGVTPIPGATNSNYTTNKSGSYTVKVFQGTCFATSAATVVSVNPLPNATVSNLDATNDICFDASIKLKANNGTGYTYQWYKGASMLAGATTQIYYATTQGNYKVKVTAATGCNKTSAPYSIINTCREENEIEYETQLTVYPNPNDGKYTLLFSSECNSELSITIFDAIGRLILEDNGKIEGNIFSEKYDLSGYSKGSYLVKVVCDEGAHYVNVIVQ